LLLVDPESVRYKRVIGEANGAPFVLEVAFGVKKDDEAQRNVVSGINWTPALCMPMMELPWLLQEMRVDEDDPAVILFHLATPTVNFTDRGKSRLALPPATKDALKRCLRSVTAAWKQEKRTAERVSAQRLEHLRRQKKRHLGLKAAVWQ